MKLSLVSIIKLSLGSKREPQPNQSIVSFAPGYSNISKKLSILNYHNPAELLNKRSELMAKCRHENKFLLNSYKGHKDND